MMCNQSSFNMTELQSTYRYLEHVHVGMIGMLLLSQNPVILSLFGYMALDIKSVHIVLNMFEFTS